ncbi:MAG TPA: NADH-quinone oxidoreductase subunit J [Symbiobacteriaceae bacterium]|nr:NADH-quinone oxidoreductase subunit J [Symbiobacteriaceae bacterium]
MTLDLLLSGQFIAFAILAIVALVSTYRMVVVPLITHAALFMALSFTAVAGIFLLLQAEFVAAIQVLIYAGAITTMVIFAIMLSGLRDIKKERSGSARVYGANWFVFLVGAIFAFFMSGLYYAANLPKQYAAESVAKVRDIGEALFTTYMIPFEISSILLLIAMVGAIILTAKEVEQE